MGDATSIEWTDATWNPLRGCSDVSPGCTNCYAKGVAARFSGPGLAYEGLGRWSAKRMPLWTGEIRLIREQLDLPLRWKRPRNVFVNSMSDLFHEKASFHDIAAIFGIMAAAPQHRFQVLTKRPQRMLDFFHWVSTIDTYGGAQSDHAEIMQLTAMDHGGLLKALGLTRVGREYRSAKKRIDGMLEPTPWPLPNVFLGVSVENQEVAGERIPLVLQAPVAPSAGRFLACEPLLERVDIGTWLHLPPCPQHPGERAAGWGHMPCDCRPHIEKHAAAGTMGKIDWVIVGGESGPRSRPFDVDWARDLVADCKAAGVPVFVKQLGANSFGHVPAITHKKGADMSEWPAELRVRQMPKGLL